MVNSDLCVGDSSVANLHLTSKDLLAINQRPKVTGWVAASCHNQQQLKHAEKIGLDFVVLAPVLATLTHPDTEPLGWEMFKSLINGVNIPVFALGGMTKKHQKTAQSYGGQGIAGITCFIQDG